MPNDKDEVFVVNEIDDRSSSIRIGRIAKVQCAIAAGAIPV